MVRMRGLAIIASVALASAALAGCSSSWRIGSSDDPTNSPSVIGGMTTCSEDAIKPVLKASLASGVQLMSMDDLMCDDGWAVANATIGDGDKGAPTPFIFEQEGQFWIPKQQQDVCGTIDFDADPVVRPADAQVPAGLFEPACLVG